MFLGKKTKLFSALALVFVAMLVFAGCAKSPSADNAPDNAGEKGEGLSGTITVVGSDSMQTLAGELAEAFEAQNPEAMVNVQGGGSGASFEPVRSGIAQLGLVSRELKDEEKDFTPVVVALDGIAVVVNKNNPVSDLTKEQIAKIYAGEITNWSEIGGKDQKITVISREAGSGTTGAFEEIVMKTIDKEIAPAVLRLNQSEGIRATVAQSEDAIGFFSLYLADETVKTLKVDGAVATDENVKNGSYTVQRPFHFTYKTDPVGVAKAFLDFTLSAEGQEIVTSEGLISIK